MDEIDEQISALAALLAGDPGNAEISKLVNQLKQARTGLLAQKDTASPQFGEYTLDGATIVGKVLSTESSATRRLLILGTDVVKEFPAEEVRILRPIEAKLCGKGSKVEAVYPKHGKYYPARIVEKGLTKDSYVVLFEGYGDKTVLDACLLRPRVASAEKKGEEEPAYVTPGGYRIPESLKIKDKDSEWVKENKKRKIHEIKSEQRIEKQTHDAEERKQNWKQFQAKISRKK